MITAQAFAAFGLFALFSRGYFWLVVLLTPTALLTLGAVDYQGDSDALQRAAWSALGIVARARRRRALVAARPHAGRRMSAASARCARRASGGPASPP